MSGYISTLDNVTHGNYQLERVVVMLTSKLAIYELVGIEARVGLWSCYNATLATRGTVCKYRWVIEEWLRPNFWLLCLWLILHLQRYSIVVLYNADDQLWMPMWLGPWDTSLKVFLQLPVVWPGPHVFLFDNKGMLLIRAGSAVRIPTAERWALISCPPQKPGPELYLRIQTRCSLDGRKSTKISWQASMTRQSSYFSSVPQFLRRFPSRLGSLFSEKNALI